MAFFSLPIPRRIGWVLAGTVVLGVGAWVALHLSRAPVPPEPPQIDLADKDPDVAAVLERARERVLQSPRSAEVWGRLGMVLTAFNYMPEARFAFAEAEKLDSQDARWPYLQGVTAVREDSEQAIGQLRRAIELDPAKEWMRLRLAEVLLEQDEVKEAARTFREVLQQVPSDPRAHLGLARAALWSGELEASEKHLSFCLANASGRKAAHILLAEIYQRQGKRDRVAKEQQILATLPADSAWPDPLTSEIVELRTGKPQDLEQAEHLLAEGRTGEAVNRLQEATLHYPDDFHVWTLLGKALCQQQDYAAAGTALQRALKIQPRQFEAHYYLGLVLLARSQPADAARHLRQATELAPGYGAAHHYLGLCLAAQGDRSGAMAAFRNAVRYEPNASEPHRELGKLLSEGGQRKEAVLELKEATRLNPQDEKAGELLKKLHATGRD